MTFPDPPEVPASQTAEAPVQVRYEDIAQDGRLKLDAVPTALGTACWQGLLAEHPISQLMREQGVLAILSRIVIEGGGGPLSVAHPWQSRGLYHLAHTADDAGRPTRLILTLQAELWGPRDRTHGPKPEGAGEPIRAGRIHAEHVFTRPFAPRADRKVLRLDHPELPAVPETRVRWYAPSRAMLPPDGAIRLDREPRPAARPVVFGQVHTDSNQHVNSLVYPRMFEEAALVRFSELGLSTDLLAERVELAYRKPCFAGERMQLLVQAVRMEGRLGAVGAFVPDSGDDRRPHCYVRMWFS